MSIVATILMFVCFFGILAGVLGVIKPSFVDIESRKDAVSVIVFFLLLLVVAGYIMPPSNTSASDAKIKKGLEIVVPNDLSDDNKKLLSESWVKIKKACMGFDRYADSMIFDGIENNFRLTIKFKISGNSIPDYYAGNGHTCYYEINKNGTELIIAKNVCQSICLDKDSKAKSDIKIPLN